MPIRRKASRIDFLEPIGKLLPKFAVRFQSTCNNYSSDALASQFVPDSCLSTIVLGKPFSLAGQDVFIQVAFVTTPFRNNPLDRSRRYVHMVCRYRAEASAIFI